MKDNMNKYTNRIYGSIHKTDYDEGLRQYFLKIYALMCTALAITAITAFGVVSIPALTNLMFNITPYGVIQNMTALGMVITFAPLAISLYFVFGFDKISAENAKVLLWVYASLIGASLASLGFIYTSISIAKTFFICSGMFGSMSLYGYATKKDLTSLGSFLFMGLLGLILASLVNFLFKSPAIEFTVSIIGVFIFIGLIAYDTQKLKSLYFGRTDNEKLGIMAAFILYLDFSNLFIYLLRFFGIRRKKEQ